MKIKTALISVSDKSNLDLIADFCKRNDIQVISTGGSFAKLKELGLEATPIEQITGNPESFDGRMKTISFQIGSGILFDRGLESHIQQAQDLKITAIDMVVCNLYPFEEVAKSSNDESKRIQNIDIGGPTMIRAAAKNFEHVAVLSNPLQYQSFVENYENSKLDREYRKDLAISAFKMTATYDQFIVESFLEESSEHLTKPVLGEEKNLRYGENSHQKAQFVQLKKHPENNLFNIEQLHGKELSFNNYLDMDAAWKSSWEVKLLNDLEHAVSVVKHNNPCGLSASGDQLEALKHAWLGDPVSAFGSIIGFTSEVNKNSAEFLAEKFVEVILAPSFSKEAFEILSQKKNLRLIKTSSRNLNEKEAVYRSICGGLLVTEEDQKYDTEFVVKTKKSLPEEMKSLRSFASTCGKYLKSNGICLVQKTENNTLWMVAAGMGQPNRLEALERLVVPRFNDKENLNMNDSLLYSDAFFPFKDSIEIANSVGVKYIIQPGGSIRDEEVIEACDQFGIAMEFTGTRHFRH
ncbi:MAG: bifunctional phosphoribosylaminoimidazolecarboxamide formyltransferase/IMP cyclohydrolase PurH [Bdellovibrionaceae bacterium]|nr:bifunctional phosphoribosylaminoimidazolecarboxamide formyltransferase/IMP cyclohydrolase PurH [Pseudobdellovibrionaceae bacterium]|tara:strand:- start:6470 stop:8032 length:1563 start_codon:yes stop_codon:yes gene_type:complete